MEEIFENETGWYWVPLDCDVVNEERIKGIGPFDTKMEALTDAVEHCWAPGNPEFKGS